MNEVIEHIDQFEKLKLGEVIDFDKFNEYAITGHSTMIEGSTLTLEETSLLLDEGVTPSGKPLEHSIMATDHHKALMLVKQIAKTDQKITVSMLQQISAKVMAGSEMVNSSALGTTHAYKGDLRKVANRVAARYFPDPKKVPVLLQQMCDDINSSIGQVQSTEQKLELAFNAHFQFVSIHPFLDGNGRVSRLLMNLLLHRFELPMAIVFKEDKLEYFNALEQSREKEEMQPFYQFMASQYTKHLKSEINQFKGQSNTNSSRVKKGQGPEKSKGFSFLF